MSDGNEARGERTYSVEEVGEIFHRATIGGPADPSPVAGDGADRVNWDELLEIAAEVGISEQALRRSIGELDPDEHARAAPAISEGASAPADDLAKAGRTLARDVAITGGVVAAAGGAALATGAGAPLFLPVVLLAPIALLARSVWLMAPHVGSLVRTSLAENGRGSTEPSDNAYRVAFGEQTVDLTHMSAVGPTEVVDVQVLFGEALIRLPPNVPYRVETSVAFGEVKLPHGAPTSSTEPRIVIRLKVRFGSARVKLAGEHGLAGGLKRLLG